MVMMDFKDKESSPGELSENKKCCTDCKTTKTPLWRVGPAGPKSLCNACGIRYRKQRTSAVGLKKGQERKREKGRNRCASGSPSRRSTSAGSGKTVSIGGSDLRTKLMALGDEVLLQRPSSVVMKKHKRRGNLGEEEQAAFCLMALSCGFVFA
ncbi:hypothetical protein L6164_034975 [Bauhinia variegata]|uniref:Uncharacterized protein n=1 Tax=Bauhinia variegata TaxID=167791 RepID=A0ACB9KX26_BAUVA|nr:hypothetical protein L6164_034975 [Bauhinia variegata]